jgi:hypothetical protein
MSTTDEHSEREEQAQEFLERFFGLEPATPPSDLMAEAHTTLTGRNQPEFHADAPWRLDVGLDTIPLLLIIREANLRPPAMGPWRMQSVQIEQELPDGHWYTLLHYAASELPEVAPDGTIQTDFWAFRTRIPVEQLANVDLERRGETVRLRVVFDGRFPPDVPGLHSVYRYLETYLAREPLPLRRAAGSSEPRCWFYGDTHYHSAFTNDIWEFGNPVRDARDAGIAIGLDWLVITDHSCDLDEKDDDTFNLSRWERLKRELSRWSVSNHTFRCILGEEVTVRKGGIGYLHMLAIGGLRRLIEGGFWSDSDHLVKQVAQKLIDRAAHQGGYPDDVVERLFDKMYTLEEALAQLPPTTLAFAAHPQTAAQPPFINGTWDTAQLVQPRLTGYEFWNGRTRHKTELLAAPTDDPFKMPAWNDQDQLVKADDRRISRLKQWAEEKWDPVLQRGVDEWALPDDEPPYKPVFIAGSDAHGDFNYAVGVGWDYQLHGMISDNALGRVRTVLHLPHHPSLHVPPIRQILAALKQGACVVTDGPVLELSLRQGNHVAYLGEVLAMQGGDQPEVSITVHTTPEFGSAEQVELVTYSTGDKSAKRSVTSVGVGSSELVKLRGKRGYCRAMVQTTGRDGEKFCCFTNPIWFWNLDDQPQQLRIHVQ